MYEIERDRGGTQIRFHRPVSMDEVLDSAMKERSLRPSDFAGTVVMTDREADEISLELNRFWSRWRIPKRLALDRGCAENLFQGHET